MNIIFNDENKDHLIEIIDNGFEEIKIEPIDYVNNKYVIDDGKLKIDGNAHYRIPKKSLSNYFKSQIGENLVCNILNLERTDSTDIYNVTSRGCTYDLVNCSNSVKIDVKSGFQNNYFKIKNASFMHFLATNKPGHNGIKISEKKYKKNYQAEGIDSVMCIDFFDNPNTTPNAYVLPTGCNEVKSYSTINITDSKKSSYNKYKKDISGVFKNDWIFPITPTSVS